MSYVGIILTFVLVNNFVLTYFLGICPAIGASRRVESSIGLGLAASILMAVAALLTWALRTWILLPLGLLFLQTFVFVLSILALGYYLERLVETVAPALHRSVGKYLPTVSTNCVVLGIALIAARSDFGPLESLIAGVSAGGGFLLVMVIVSTIREKLETEPVPRALRGVPIAFITTGLMALALLAFDQAFLRNVVG